MILIRCWEHEERIYILITLRMKKSNLCNTVEQSLELNVHLAVATDLGESIQKFPDWVDNEIYAYKNKHSLRSNTKGYGDKTH
jgi:hypothetical protein